MRFVALLLVFAIAGCGALRPSASAGWARADAGGVLPTRHRSGSTTPIQHVVIVVQENRTVDNLFQGFPGADTQDWGMMNNGKRVKLRPVPLNSTDIDNSYHASIQDYDGGKMDGFNLNHNYGSMPPTYAYSYVDRNDIKPYWAMARFYELADHMFPTMHGQSWTAHIDVIAGTTNLSPKKALVDFPSDPSFNCAAPAGTTTPFIDAKGNYNVNGPYPCLTQFRTMADTLDAGAVSWRYYAPNDGVEWTPAWSPFGEIKNVYDGADWKRNVVPGPPNVLTDVAAGKLAQVTWVAPDWNFSDHAGSGSTTGPEWVAAVVNAIGKSKFWKSTAIVVIWDDFGGWYDHVPPPQLDFRGLGIRVPCLIISPYVHDGVVDHTQYEFGSILRFIEDDFQLPQLGTAADGYSDARATSLMNAFDFTQKPRRFEPIPAPPFSSS